MNYDKKCQLLIVGDAAVGKTSILRRFSQDKFNPNYLSTLGIDFFTKDVILNDKKIHIKMWDTAGQERYKSLTQGFLRNAQGIILVYDIKEKESFNNLKYWIDSIQYNIDLEKKKIPLIIMGNKIDLSERKVEKIDAENFAKSKNYKYFEVSAKSGEGVDESIKYLIELVIKEVEKQEKNGKEIKTIKIENNNIKENKLKIKMKDCCNPN